MKSRVYFLTLALLAASNAFATLEAPINPDSSSSTSDPCSFMQWADVSSTKSNGTATIGKYKDIPMYFSNQPPSSSSQSGSSANSCQNIPTSLPNSASSPPDKYALANSTCNGPDGIDTPGCTVTLNVNIQNSNSQSPSCQSQGGPSSQNVYCVCCDGAGCYNPDKQAANNILAADPIGAGNATTSAACANTSVGSVTPGAFTQKSQ